MDDDYEIRSNPSPVSGSPMSSPKENRRITVTVASPAPVQPAANSLALALPIQQQPRGSNGGSGGSGGREDCWSEGATAVLIDAWGERYLELNRGNLKQKHWKEVADVVSSRDDYPKTPKTDIQCKNRIDTVKKRYKTEKAKISDGGGITTSKWQFFDKLDQLIGPTAKISNATGTITVGNSNSPLQKVPLGLPVIPHTGGGGGSANQYHPQKQPQQIQLKNRKLQLHQCDLPDSSDSPVSSDSYPPEGNEKKKAKGMKEKEGGKKRKDWGIAMKEMSKAIIKFGEVYEQTETSKVKQIVEMENQRMQFVKDLELQRMQFFMKIQSEISQLMDPTNHHSNNSNDNNNGGNNKKKDNNNGGNKDNNNHNTNNSESE